MEWRVETPSWAKIRFSAILFIVSVLGNEPQNENHVCRLVCVKACYRISAF